MNFKQYLEEFTDWEYATDPDGVDGITFSIYFGNIFYDLDNCIHDQVNDRIIYGKYDPQTNTVNADKIGKLNVLYPIKNWGAFKQQLNITRAPADSNLLYIGLEDEGEIEGTFNSGRIDNIQPIIAFWYTPTNKQINLVIDLLKKLNMSKNLDEYQIHVAGSQVAPLKDYVPKKQDKIKADLLHKQHIASYAKKALKEPGVAVNQVRDIAKTGYTTFGDSVE